MKCFCNLFHCNGKEVAQSTAWYHGYTSNKSSANMEDGDIIVDMNQEDPINEDKPGWSAEFNAESTSKAFASAILLAKTAHFMSEAAITELLIITKTFLGPFLNDKVNLPSSFDQAQAMVEKDLTSLQRHDVCVNECCLFVGEKARMSHCPICKTQRDKSIVFYSVPLIPRIEKFFANKVSKISVISVSSVHHLTHAFNMNMPSKELAQILRYPFKTKHDPSVVSDIVDGRLFRKEFLKRFGESETNLAFGMTIDGVNLDSKGQRSMWPVSFELINFPPWIRKRIGFILLGGIIPTHPTKGFRDRRWAPYIQYLIEDFKIMETTG